MSLRLSQIYILLFHSICLISEIVSIFYPFQIKTNVHAGDLGIPRIEFGFEYSLIPFTLLLLIVIAYYSVIVNRILPIVVFSVLALGFVQLIRYSIHFQGYIDHDYDTNAGFGFYLFFWVVIVQLLVSLSLKIWDRYSFQSKSTTMNGFG
jgi:hypothetical protein